MLMFMMNTDSQPFLETREQLEEDGWALEGNVFVRGADRMLPLYEAKMIHHFDHRFATYEEPPKRKLNNRHPSPAYSESA